jgi:hypothetical protein
MEFTPIRQTPSLKVPPRRFKSLASAFNTNYKLRTRRRTFVPVLHFHSQILPPKPTACQLPKIYRFDY